MRHVTTSLSVVFCRCLFMKGNSMFRPRPCRARVSALVTVFLVALSLCVSSLSPFVRASVADDHVRAAEVALASADVAAGTRNVSDGVSADVEVSVTAT